MNDLTACPGCVTDDDTYPDCDVHVRCDDSCGALLAPDTPEEIWAAYVHWRYHGSMGGCSHGN